jgi:hypothetical protein
MMKEVRAAQEMESSDNGRARGGPKTLEAKGQI